MSSEAYSHIVVGGGSAGCVLANRLSARAGNRVLLIEAGDDTPPDDVPEDIAAAYSGRAAMNPNYIWRGLMADQSGREGGPAGRIAIYEQARVMGGGSSINGQIGVRGAPSDYDQWAEMGAEGWDWNSVLPYFRRLERDLDFDNPQHGCSGPVPLRRTPRDRWDGFSTAIADALKHRGVPFLDDINGGFETGFAATPLNNLDGKRVSTAVAYLDADTRRRANLRIASRTFARRILFDGTRASAVEIEGPRGRETIAGREIIVSCGSILSPALLMRSGVGPADSLRRHGVDVVVHSPAVGLNLQEHAAVHVSAYLAPPGRIRDPQSRHNVIYMRYESGVPGARPPDMLLNFACRSGWHAVGARLATIQAYILQPFSTGSVTLASADPHVPPRVHLNLVGDERDAVRLADAVERAVALFHAAPVRDVASHPFLTCYSDRVRRVGQVNWYNSAMTKALASTLDLAGPSRGWLIDGIVSDSKPMKVLLKDRDALMEHVRRTVTGVWHPTGTCRMGRRDDPLAVTDPRGRLVGAAGLRVADCSIAPEIPRGNTNLPAIMIGERMADLILDDG